MAHSPRRHHRFWGRATESKFIDVSLCVPKQLEGNNEFCFEKVKESVGTCEGA